MKINYIYIGIILGSIIFNSHINYSHNILNNKYTKIKINHNIYKKLILPDDITIQHKQKYTIPYIKKTNIVDTNYTSIIPQILINPVKYIQYSMNDKYIKLIFINVPKKYDLTITKHLMNYKFTKIFHNKNIHIYQLNLPLNNNNKKTIHYFKYINIFTLYKNNIIQKLIIRIKVNNDINLMNKKQMILQQKIYWLKIFLNNLQQIKNEY